MATKPLPMIPGKYFKKTNGKPNGHVDLWDMEITDGPAKIDFTIILAREALQRGGDRFRLDLPKGVKPGQLQLENEERARADADAASDEPPDPVYGRTPA